MRIIRPDYFIFGYRKVCVSQDKISEFSTILLHNQIDSQVCSNGDVLVKESSIRKIQKIFNGRDDISFSAPLGVYGWWKSQKSKAAICLGIVASIVLLICSSQIIWDIRPEGNNNISDFEIVERLSRCGFDVGKRWSGFDLADVEKNFLLQHSDVAWININRRGSVAYVSLIEKSADQIISEDRIFYSNILSTRSCVVEEVTVKSGTAIVKPGDSVNAGEVLILGTKSIGEEPFFCRAEGKILGRVSDTITIDVKRFYEKRKISGKRVCSVNLNIFKKYINIFKTYGNLPESYDIIEDVKEYILPGGTKLPFSIHIQYTPIYQSEQVMYTDDELVMIASDRLKLELSLRLIGSDLDKISTRGEFTDDGYTMSSDLVYITDVGYENPFTISD